jgi:Uma2 family endonuclease
MSAIARPLLHRWTYDQWDRIVASGSLDGQRVELIGGEAVEMPPQCEPHVLAICLTAAAMRRIFPEPAYWVRVQSPLRLVHDSEPEPDSAVVTGPPRDYVKTGPPRKALLVIEVAYSSLDFDRTDKASLYASAGILDYRIINLVDSRCEVYRQPAKDAAQRFGYRYSPPAIYKSGDVIVPLASKADPVAVDDLLP